MRDKVSAVTHLMGIILSAAGTWYLAVKSMEYESIKIIGANIVFGGSMILLYTASTVYHWIKNNEKAILTARKIDHMMIFVLIAGTYTPVCINILDSRLGYIILSAVWILTIAGIVLALLWIDMPRKISSGIYIMMGWISIILLYQLVRAMTAGTLILLVSGGVIYTIGGIIYGGKIDLFKNKNFGFHETFHLFILAGSALHYFMVLNSII